ncbi:MAG: F0F1 ATP synthase subunit epsilon [Planctomycetota bacterium]
MPGTVRCKLITPEAALLDDDVNYASVPAWDGLMGIQHGGAPLVAKLGMGELRFDFPDSHNSKGGSHSYFIEDGFLRFAENELTLLASNAIPVENLNESDLSAELQEAEARTVTEGADNALEEMNRITAERNRTRTKLALAKKFKGKGI